MGTIPTLGHATADVGNTGEIILQSSGHKNNVLAREVCDASKVATQHQEQSFGKVRETFPFHFRVEVRVKPYITCEIEYIQSGVLETTVIHEIIIQIFRHIK